MPMPRWPLWSAILLLSAIVAGGATLATGLWSPSRRSAAEAASAPEWISPRVTQQSATITTTGTVRLRSNAIVRVGSQVSGVVRGLRVSVGANVRRGDIIAEIDTRLLDAKVAQSEAQLRLDEVLLEKARMDRKRIAGALLSVSRQSADDLLWAEKSAEARVAKSESDVSEARQERSYATIRAPIDGIVASVSTQEGETVAASFAAPTFVTIVQDHAVELSAMVDETDIGHVTRGMPVEFTTEAFPAHALHAVVRRIDPTATIVSGVVNYPVICDIEETPTEIRPDMTANVSIATGQRRIVLVPLESVVSSGSERYVVLSRGGAMRRQIVVTGARTGSDVEIISGVMPADRLLRQPVAAAPHSGGGRT
jgi:macrolide-specific efflux system membrane fusion protein